MQESAEHVHMPVGNEGLPSEMNAEHQLGKCHLCPSYSYSSKTEKQRHTSLFHRKQNEGKGRRRTANTRAQHVCKYQTPANASGGPRECGMTFTSKRKLAKHQREARHRKRGANQKLAGPANKKTRSQPTLQSFLDRYPHLQRENCDDDDDDDDDDTRDDESVSESGTTDNERFTDEDRCGVCQGREEDDKEIVSWISCDTCQTWYHYNCVPTTNDLPSEEEFEEISWVCHFCC